MADDAESTRTHESIKITVVKCSRLKGQKGDALTSFVHVEFDGKSLGDSSKVESNAECETEYNYTTSFDCSLVDGNYTLDDISYKPVLLTFTEVLPKEKKQKEEKTAQLGQCTVDLLPLMHGETKFNQTLTIHAMPGSPLENLPADAKKAEVELTISVNEAVLNPHLLSNSNLLTIRVGSAYSLPETWSLIGPQYNYTVGLPIPTQGEKELPLIFSHGTMKPGAEKEPTVSPMKWFNLPNVTNNAHFIPNGGRERIPMDEEKGDFPDKEFRHEVESEKNRVTWNIERRCYLEPAARTNFQNKIAKTRLWPVELMRTPPPSQGKAAGGSKKDKSSGDDENQISYHGIAYVDMAPLLYPGQKTVAGVFQIHPFSDVELDKKTMRKHAIAADVARINSSMSRMTGSSPVQKGGSKAGARDTISKKGSALMRGTDSGSEVGSTTGGQQYVEAKAYEDARTFIYLEFTLRQPLVPRREPEQLARLVSEYIPPRGPYKRLTGGADKAVGDYHNQISSISAMVLDEFREMFGEELLEPDSSDHPEKQEHRRRMLLYKLNSSGKYFAFKEQIKHSVVKIVREKYMKTTAFTNKDELQQFLSELYVYLVDEMHAALDKVLTVDVEAEDTPEPVADSVQLKRFAQEAELNEDFDIANSYYQERLTKDKNDPGHWYDYGVFNLLISDYAKARECFRESVAIKQDNMEGLIMYGVLSSMEEQYEEAETVFERATTLSSDLPSALPWTVLAMFYDSIGNDIRAEHSYAEARKLNEEFYSPKLEKQIEGEEEEHKPDIATAGSIDLDGTSSSLLPPSAGPTKQTSASIRSSSTKGSRSKKDGTRIRSSTENSTSSREQMHSDHEKDEHHLDKKDVLRKTIFLEAAQWLLDMNALKFTEVALGHELLEPLGGPSADYFVTLARLQMKRKEYIQAEDSLKQATSHDHMHSDAWANTGHYHYVTGNLPSARDCYERTLAFISNASEMHSIYLRLASIYLFEEQYLKAKNTYLLACKHSPSCISWLGVGQACYRLNELSEAEDALAEANILNNQNAEVWAYLSLVCLRTNRKLEAEQSYKYALKLNLKDDLLINEISKVQSDVGFGNPSF